MGSRSPTPASTGRTPPQRWSGSRPRWRPGAAHEESRPPMRVAVLGVGLIGGSIGLAARRRMEAAVVGYGRSPERLARAVELGAIDRAAGSLAEACEGADLVFCCAPVAALPEQGREALAAAGPETVVTDV